MYAHDEFADPMEMLAGAAVHGAADVDARAPVAAAAAAEEPEEDNEEAGLEEEGVQDVEVEEGATQATAPMAQEGSPEQLLAAREAGARRIAPGVENVEPKSDWPAGMPKPMAPQLKAELTRRLGGKDTMGRKKVTNMGIPELVRILKSMPVEPVVQPTPPPDDTAANDTAADDVPQRNQWCAIEHGPRLAHAIYVNKELFLLRDQKAKTRAELDGAARNSGWQAIAATFNSDEFKPLLKVVREESDINELVRARLSADSANGYICDMHPKTPPGLSPHKRDGVNAGIILWTPTPQKIKK